MGHYQFTEQAKQDLIKIRRFTLDNWGADQSKHYLSEMKNTVSLLAKMPLMGKSCLEDLDRHVYRYVYGSHVIYYLTLSEEEIVVIAILHQSMVPGKHLVNR